LQHRHFVVGLVAEDADAITIGIAAKVLGSLPSPVAPRTRITATSLLAAPDRSSSTLYGSRSAKAPPAPIWRSNAHLEPKSLLASTVDVGVAQRRIDRRHCGPIFRSGS